MRIGDVRRSLLLPYSPSPHEYELWAREITNDSCAVLIGAVDGPITSVSSIPPSRRRVKRKREESSSRLVFFPAGAFRMERLESRFGAIVKSGCFEKAGAKGQPFTGPHGRRPESSRETP